MGGATPGRGRRPTSWGALIRRSRQTAARCLAALAGWGYLRRRADGGYDLGPPGARGFVEPGPDECQGELFAAAPCPPVSGPCPPVDVPPPHTPRESLGSESEKTTTDVVGESSSCPSRPDGGEIAPDLVADLVAEAVRIFGFKADVAELLIRDTARLFDAETRKRPDRREWSRFEAAWIREALARAEAGRGRAKVFDWGFVTGILKNIARRGGPGPAPPPSDRAAKEAAGEARREQAAAQERERERLDRERDGRLRAAWDALPEPEREAIRAAVRAENPGIGRWKAMLEPLCLAELERRRSPPPGEKTPAAGSHGNDPPPPGREMIRSNRPTESYPQQGGSARPRGEHRTPHDAGRCATPAGNAEAASDHTIQSPHIHAPSDAGAITASIDRPAPARREAVPAGAHAGPRRLFDADGPARLLRSPEIESDPAAGRRQRDSDGPPDPHRRE